MTGGSPAVGAVQDRVSEGERILEVVTRFERPLISYALRIVSDLDRAREIVQETFLRLCADTRAIDQGRIAPWLFTVCRNLAIDSKRRDQRMSSMDEVAGRADEGPNPREVVELRKDSAAVLVLLEKLPKNQQEVLRLKFLHDLSYKEISEVTNLSIGNVGYLIHVGLKALRDQMSARETHAAARSLP